MQTKLLAEQESKTFAVIFETGEEVAAGLLQFAQAQQLSASHFTAIGAFSEVTLGYFDVERKEYLRIPLQEQVEVLSLVGDITLKDGAPQVHAHVVVGKRNGTAWGGHLMEARVRPTLEVVVTEAPRAMQRRFDVATGLALIRFD